MPGNRESLKAAKRCEVKRLIYLVGIGTGTAADLTERARHVILQADAVAGASRMLQLLDELPESSAKRFAAYRPEDITGFFMEQPDEGTGCVLFSGDVGFYSGAQQTEKALNKAGFPTMRIPGVSSMLCLCAKAGIPWENVHVVSLHGQQGDIVSSVRDHRYTFLLPGRGADLSKAAERLMEFGFADAKTEVTAGELLGYPDERVRSLTLREAAQAEYCDLCCALIENKTWRTSGEVINREGVCVPETVTGGEIPDTAFIRGQVPMTKSEVRDVIIAKLGLARSHVLFDVGAGTGSVSVQAALMYPQLSVYAIENRPEALELIRQNTHKFRTGNVHVTEGTAPDIFSSLPVPDAAMIGGSGGRLQGILQALLSVNPRMRIVMSFVTIEGVSQAADILQQMKIRDCEMVQISVARARVIGGYHLMTGQNPVTIMTVNGCGTEKGRES